MEKEKKEITNIGKSNVNFSMLALPYSIIPWCKVGLIAYLAVVGLLFVRTY